MNAVPALRIPEPPDPRDSVILRLVECELRAYISEIRADAKMLRQKANGDATSPQDGHEP